MKQTSEPPKVSATIGCKSRPGNCRYTPVASGECWSAFEGNEDQELTMSLEPERVERIQASREGQARAKLPVLHALRQNVLAGDHR